MQMTSCKKCNENTFYFNPMFNAKVEGSPTTSLLFGWMTENFAYSNILSGLFMAFGVKIFLVLLP